MTRLLVKLTGIITFGCIFIVFLMTVVGRILPQEPELIYNGGFYPLKLNIYRMSVQRHLTVQLTHDPNPSWIIGWSQDGEQITFVSESPTISGIYLMDAVGEGIHILTTDLYRIDNPIWSPDNQHIAYIRQTDDYKQLMLLNLQPVALQTMTDVSYNVENLAWSPDSSRLAFASGSDVGNSKDINLLDVKTGQIHLLASIGDLVTSLAWSPDGSRIIFVSYTRSNQAFAIYLADLQTGTLQLLVQNAVSPELSPDGKKLLYVDLTNGPLRVLDMTTGKNEPFYTGTVQASGISDWSASSPYLLYIYFDIRDSKVYQFPISECLQQADSCSPELLSDQGFFGNFHWRPIQP